MFCTPTPCVNRHASALSNLNSELATTVACHTSNNLISTLGHLAMAGEWVTDVGRQRIDKLTSE